MTELAAGPPRNFPLIALARRHPLIGYFVLAYAGSWLLTIPLALSQRGLNVVYLPDALALLLFILAAYAGPFMAAFVMTGATAGRAGISQLLRRMVQWRVGPQWYLLILLGYPLLWVIGSVPFLGLLPMTAFVGGLPLLLTLYLPIIVQNVLLVTIGEETGWRGFALPRLQALHGALVGSLILGALHALWHLPVYFIPGAILPGAFDPLVFVTNSAVIVAITLIWTWIYNGASGSILIAILAHAASNGASGLIPQLFTGPQSPWPTVAIAAVAALIVVVATRGRLGYRGETATIPEPLERTDGRARAA